MSNLWADVRQFFDRRPLSRRGSKLWEVSRRHKKLWCQRSRDKKTPTGWWAEAAEALQDLCRNRSKRMLLMVWLCCATWILHGLSIKTRGTVEHVETPGRRVLDGIARMRKWSTFEWQEPFRTGVGELPPAALNQCELVSFALRWDRIAFWGIFIIFISHL